MKLLKVTWDNRWETFSLIIKAYTKKYPREIQSRVEWKLSEITVSDLLEILFYSKLEDLTRWQIKTYIIWLVNKWILKWTATKKDIDYLLQLYKEIIEKEHKFLYNDLKTELWIQDTNEYIQKEQIKPCDLNEVLLKKYFKKIKLHKEKEIENIFWDNIDLNESKYYQVFPDTKVDIIRQKTQTHYLLQKWGTQSISIYQITKDWDVCKESHLRQWKEVEDLIKKYNLV